MVTTANEYRISSSDVFFFDNNIWMFIYGIIGNYERKKQETYSNLLGYIIERKRPIFINSLVISEFVNANLRNEYEIWKMKPENFSQNKYKEHYLKSTSYQSTLKSVLAALKSILSITTKGNDNFNAIQLDNVFNEMTDCDFNDAYYLQYSKLGNYIIVTDDGDLYKNNKSGINIITYKL